MVSNFVIFVYLYFAMPEIKSHYYKKKKFWNFAIYFKEKGFYEIYTWKLLLGLLASRYGALRPLEFCAFFFPMLSLCDS